MIEQYEYLVIGIIEKLPLTLRVSTQIVGGKLDITDGKLLRGYGDAEAGMHRMSIAHSTMKRSSKYGRTWVKSRLKGG